MTDPRHQNTVRPMSPQDVDAAKQLLGRLQDYLGTMRPGRLPWSEMQTDYWRWIEDKVKSNDGFIFVAEKSGKLVGMIIGWVDEAKDPAYPPELWKRGWVQDLYVDEPARRQNIARQLMDAAKAFFNARDISKICLYVVPANPARDFYKRYGMHDGLIRMDAGK